MSSISKSRYKDDWLVRALLYYQIIDEELYEELQQRFADSEFFYDVLTGNGYLQPEDIALFVENALKIPSINLDKVRLDPKIIKIIPEEFCRKYWLMPFELHEKYISVACFNPTNLNVESQIEQLTGKYVKTFFASKDQIIKKINEYYNPDKLICSLVKTQKRAPRITVAGVKADKDDTPVVKLVNQIIFEAIEEGASDIHIEPKEEIVSVRYRIDGILRNVMDVPRSLLTTLMSRIKIISNLNIAETRKPQDGKAKIKVDDADIDLRVSILPTSYGEKAVIRILDKRKALVSFEKMGIRGHNREYLEKCFEFKQGMVLVTGPTGSGKSTTLYAAINRVRSTANNILTIEDPIEYRMEGINQVQVNEKAGITFSSALRSFLRQDPDVILVGEIRDKETAEIAIQAALTGHLVLSTLHTNDTFATITRLQDMGIDKIKITESLQAIIAQRLIRRLCPDCKKSIKVNDVDDDLGALFGKLGYKPDIFEAKGCQRCNFSGYKGRIGVYEILLLDSEIKEMINRSVGIREIRKTARKQGFRNLFEDALSLVAEGITDYKEVLRTIHPGSTSDLDIAGTSDAYPSQTAASGPLSSPPVAEEQRRPIEEGVFKDDEKTPTILIVEDSPVARKMIRKIIEKSTNYVTMEAEDGVKALEKIDETKPDLILLDIMMPNMDGYEVLQHLRADVSTSHIPVLILTGLKSPESEIKGFELGADDYLTKPVHKDRLLARINRYLKRPEPAKITIPPEEKFKPAPAPPISEESDEELNLRLV
ncbi:MAG TPA: type II/IV secretion system protein [Caldithrix abyssi]|uniref:Type II/IV secretion system protein n=1 Tax=Caldithrix abyssi TaxID=187145 RepID=A0A7V4U0M8_CALAY|nr:type II/IV secretion system protein [Caldithrix abyssi]